MAERDGNGWVRCRCGSRHWGLNGAAGLLLLRGGDPGPEILLQLRAGWTHEGDTWGVPGGARDSHEDVVTAALREAHEEVGLVPDTVRVVGSRAGVDHGDWRYTYVIAVAEGPVRLAIGSDETDELRWVHLPEVALLTLHRAFSDAWPALAGDLGPALLG